ncbi:MAG: hypothetical protein IKJ40_05620, partial [Bacteroidales bacterium]|nr:hypothetical protein [Bacteroidales bacterium]
MRGFALTKAKILIQYNMITGGKGGGNTITGLIYEGKVDLATFLNKQEDYSVDESKVYYRGKLIARLFKKHKLYKYLEE